MSIKEKEILKVSFDILIQHSYDARKKRYLQVREYKKSQVENDDRQLLFLSVTPAMKIDEKMLS